MGRRYGGVEQHDRLQRRRERLMTAAMTVFGQKGYHESTVRDVCQAAQLTSRYFYESFDSMESLFRAIYERISDQLTQETLAALARSEPKPSHLARAALTAFFTFVQQDEHRARVVLTDASNVSHELSRLAVKVNRDFTQLTASFMTHLQPKQGTTDLDALMLAEGLVGARDRIAIKWVAECCRTPLDRVVTNALALFDACFECVGKQDRRESGH